AWEDERERSLDDVMDRAASRVMLVVGPEGGLEESEIRMLRRVGAASFSLGPRPMRAELAATAALSALMHARGELVPRPVARLGGDEGVTDKVPGKEV
ncbi:MAG TPA: RsmE family RNA methyltransferase, partial [candidate division WOR-3 bacterium]|nr:RsmE family RNA methyltransferase [candidate division WOR-3 bacterium]